jgi:hypothetical protein
VECTCVSTLRCIVSSAALTLCAGAIDALIELIAVFIALKINASLVLILLFKTATCASLLLVSLVKLFLNDVAKAARGAIQQ